MTRADVRERVRDELQDTEAGAYLWPDATLDRYFADVLAEYGQARPREMQITIQTVAGQRAYALPVELLTIVRVEYPEGCVLPRDAPRPGDGGRGLGDGDEASGAQAWEDFAGALELRLAPTADDEEILVRYQGRHVAPADDATTLTIADGDVGLLTYGVCARALLRLTVERVKLERWETVTKRGALYAGRDYEREYQKGLRRRERPRFSRLTRPW